MAGCRDNEVGIGWIERESEKEHTKAGGKGDGILIADPGDIR